VEIKGGGGLGAVQLWGRPQKPPELLQLLCLRCPLLQRKAWWTGAGVAGF